MAETTRRERDVDDAPGAELGDRAWVECLEERIALLEEASGTLLGSLQLSAVLSGILDLSHRVLAADAYGVWRYLARANHWEMVCAAGLSEAYQRMATEAYRQVPREAASLPAPFVASDALSHPQLAPNRAAHQAEGIRSLLAVPLRIQGELGGTITFYYRQPYRFEEAEIRVATALANLSASAIHNAELYEEQSRMAEERQALLEASQAASTRAEATQQRLTFLAEASRLLAASLDYQATLASVARLAVPEFADWCTVDLVQEDQSLQTVAAAHVDPKKETLTRELRRRYPPDPSKPHGVWHVLRTGQSVLIPEVTDALWGADARDGEHLKLLQVMATQTFLRVPLQARGRTLGVLSLGCSQPGRRYGPPDQALAEDLAHRAALAVDNARLYQEAQTASQAKDRFLAVLSHELRTPLTPIQACVELLRHHARDPEQVRRAAAVIERNVLLQTSLVNDLLDLSRVTQGKLSLDRRCLSLGALVAETLESLRAEAEADGINLVWKPCEDEIEAEVDPFRIQQVLWNLVGNAIKYSLPGGQIRVELSRSSGVQEDDSERLDGRVAERPNARLVVSDTGIGISPEALPRIFQMFHQEEGGPTRRGLGIGLALVEALVRLHGGRVWAESEGLGCGSRFVVELAALGVPGSGTNRNAGASTTPATGAATSEASPVPAVLLVEDNQDSRETLAEVLELLGYRVQGAASAEEALALLQVWRPQVILSDVGLPGMDGCELLRRVRQMPQQAGVVALAITGYGTVEDRQQALSAGFDGHLTKPLDLNNLDHQLRALLAAD